MEDLTVLFDFYNEGEAQETEVDQQYEPALSLIEKLELRNMLRNEEDALGALLKINPGAGGTESQIWPPGSQVGINSRLRGNPAANEAGW